MSLNVKKRKKSDSLPPNLKKEKKYTDFVNTESLPHRLRCRWPAVWRTPRPWPSWNSRFHHGRRPARLPALRSPVACCRRWPLHSAAVESAQPPARTAKARTYRVETKIFLCIFAKMQHSVYFHNIFVAKLYKFHEESKRFKEVSHVFRNYKA